MAGRGKENGASTVKIERLGGMDAPAVFVTNHDYIVSLEDLLDTKLEIGLTGERLRPVVSQRGLPMDFARSDEIARLPRPEYDVVAIVAHDPIQLGTRKNPLIFLS